MTECGSAGNIARLILVRTCARTDSVRLPGAFRDRAPLPSRATNASIANGRTQQVLPGVNTTRRDHTAASGEHARSAVYYRTCSRVSRVEERSLKIIMLAAVALEFAAPTYAARLHRR